MDAVRRDWQKDTCPALTLLNEVLVFGRRLDVLTGRNSAASQIQKGDIDWENIFGKHGIRWFHTGGIFAGLSRTTPDVVLESMSAAKKYGSIISYDLNYRASLWNEIGGKEKAIEVNRAIAPLVDVMIGNEEDFSAALGFEVEGLDEGCSKLDPANFIR